MERRAGVGGDHPRTCGEHVDALDEAFRRAPSADPLGSMASAVADDVHRGANEQMGVSAEALGATGLALVPVGDIRTCEFCVARAASGFHLPKRGSKTLARSHDHCRCKVVPGFGADPRVEGHDVAFYRGLHALAGDLAHRGYSHRQIRDAMAGTPVDELGPPNSGVGGRPRKPAVDPERRAEVARQLGLDDNDENRWAIELDLSLRDERWLAGGPTPGITYAPGAEESKRRKGNPKLFTKEHEVERGTVRLSAALGYASEFQEDEIPNPDPEDAKRRPRIGLPDLSSGMEVKTLRNASSYNTVATHAASARSKGSVSTLMNFMNNESLTKTIIDKYVIKAMDDKGLRHVVIIYPDGSHSVRIKK